MFEYIRASCSSVSDHLIEKLLSQSHNIHYLKRYLKFIQYMLIKPYRKDTYLEKHHIVPRSFDLSLSNDKFNIVLLTPREHFIAHYIFAKAFGGSHWSSVNIIAKCDNPYQHRKGYNLFDSKLYEIAKIEEAKYLSLFITNSRANETEDKKEARISKWRLNSRKCDNCSAILRGDSSNHICKKILPPPKICNVCSSNISRSSINRETCDVCRKAMGKLCIRCRTTLPVEGRRLCVDCATPEKTLIRRKIKNKSDIKFCETCSSVFNTKGPTCFSCKKNDKQKRKREQQEKAVLEDLQRKAREKKKIEDQLKRQELLKGLKCDECETIPNIPRTMVTMDDKLLCLKCDKHIKMLSKYGSNYKEMSQSEKMKHHLASLSEEDLKLRNENTSKGVLNYYVSDAYDYEKRSLEVRDGLAKNKINKTD
jgi:hypothetical protein